MFWISYDQMEFVADYNFTAGVLRLYGFALILSKLKNKMLGLSSIPRIPYSK